MSEDDKSVTRALQMVLINRKVAEIALFIEAHKYASDSLGWAAGKMRWLLDQIADYGDHQPWCELDSLQPQPGSILRPSRLPLECTCGFEAFKQ